MLFDAERKFITDFMNENGIKYMPLKGIILKELYPEIGMREMSDNDIYYDLSFREKIGSFMLSRGYKCVAEADNHDAYEKEPIYNFEFHNRLFLKETSLSLHRYYSDIDKRMIRDSKNAFSYHLSDEDFYIYLIAHEYKHYNYCGTGLRSLLDCYVFLNKFSDTLDFEYIKRETQKAGISDFEKMQRNLCGKFSVSLSDVDFTEDEVKFLQYLVSSGVHGNFSTGVINKAKGKGAQKTKVTFKEKVKYISKRVFPPMSYYKRFYPFFYNHRYLIPFCVIYRIFLAVFKRNKNIKNELRILNQTKY